MGAEIRPFAEADRSELRALFSRVGEDSPTGELWGHEESEVAVYLTPYIDLEPESLLVAVVDGALAGYLAGSLGGDGFPSERARMDFAIKEYKLMSQPSARRFFLRALLDSAWAGIRRQPTAGELEDPRWPAHLHINLVPAARGIGAAAGLMEAWFARLRSVGSPGCYLQTLVENTRAVRFFEKMGFVQHGDTPLVPGVRYDGRKLHQQTMVWSA